MQNLSLCMVSPPLSVDKRGSLAAALLMGAIRLPEKGWEVISETGKGCGASWACVSFAARATLDGVTSTCSLPWARSGRQVANSPVL